MSIYTVQTLKFWKRDSFCIKFNMFNSHTYTTHIHIKTDRQTGTQIIHTERVFVKRLFTLHFDIFRYL